MAMQKWKFQSRDWVDVYSGLDGILNKNPLRIRQFQSRDWVDVYSGFGLGECAILTGVVSIPRLG